MKRWGGMVKMLFGGAHLLGQGSEFPRFWVSCCRGRACLLYSRPCQRQRDANDAERLRRDARKRNEGW